MNRKNVILPWWFPDFPRWKLFLRGRSIDRGHRPPLLMGRLSAGDCLRFLVSVTHYFLGLGYDAEEVFFGKEALVLHVVADCFPIWFI